MVTYVMGPGLSGLQIGCLSYMDYFTVTLSVDETVMKDPEILMNLLEKNMEMSFEKYRTLTLLKG